MKRSPSLSLCFCGLALAFAQGCTLPPAPANGPMPQIGVDTSPGAHLQVARQGQWYAATVVQALPDGRVVVHYDNTGAEWNEAVGPDRIQPLPGAPSGPARDYRAGEHVLISFQGRLLVGDVLAQVAADQWRVRYDGFGQDETVGPDRLRRPFAGQSPHAVGEVLTVDVNGHAVQGRVLAVASADRWIVRFDSVGPQYDQEVGPERIKGVGPAPAAAAPPIAPAPVAAAAVAPPPSTSPAAAPAVKATAKDADISAKVLTVGETVLVRQHGAWFVATVAEVASGAVKVKYPSGGEGVASLDSVVREAAPRGAAYTPGQAVLVEYKGVFVPGKVLRLEGKDYKIRFDGTGPEGDEVIVSRRLRPR